MNLLHISDIHFRRQYPDCQEGYQGMLAAMQNPLIPLTECLRLAQQRATIDLVVISGDLTEDGDVEDYRYLKEQLHRLLGDVEIIVTLGNHDIKSNFHIGWCGTAASESPYNQVKCYSDMAIVAFDNSRYGASDGVVDEQQFHWLQQTLAELKNLPIVLVTHHHLLAHQSTTPVYSVRIVCWTCCPPITFAVSSMVTRIIPLPVRSKGFLTILSPVCLLWEKMKVKASCASKNDMAIICIVLNPVN